MGPPLLPMSVPLLPTHNPSHNPVTVQVINSEGCGYNEIVTWWFVFAEPREPQTVTCLYFYHKLCFSFWERSVYYMLVLSTGCCLAVYWAYVMATIVCWNVWCVGPCMRVCECCTFYLGWCNKLLMRCCLQPFCKAAGSFLSRLRVSHQPRPELTRNIHVFTT